MACLKAAHNLPRLDLTLSDDGDNLAMLARPINPQVPLSPLFTGGMGAETIIWPRFQHVALPTHLASTEAFLGFLERYRRTLKSLELLNTLLGTSRYKVLEAIPRILELEHVYIECVWGQEDAESCRLGSIGLGTDAGGRKETELKQCLLGEMAETPDIGGGEFDGQVVWRVSV